MEARGRANFPDSIPDLWASNCCPGQLTVSFDHAMTK
jgi:hypothetical protein